MNEWGVEIGDSVVYVSSEGYFYNALVTKVWDGASYPYELGGWPTLNLAIVSKVADRMDQYGLGIERATSVPHQSACKSPGGYWRGAGEGKG